MKIFVEGLEFVGAHGVYDEERHEGRRFIADVSVTLANTSSTRSDALEETLDYRGLAAIVLEVAHGESHSLIEWLAGEMTRRVLERHAEVMDVTVTLKKFATGVPGDPTCVGVTLYAQRDASS